MAKYEINKGLNGVIRREIEADNYKVDGEFFHLYTGSGTSAKKIFSIASKDVRTIEIITE